MPSSACCFSPVVVPQQLYYKGLIGSVSSEHRRLSSLPSWGSRHASFVSASMHRWLNVHAPPTHTHYLYSTNQFSADSLDHLHRIKKGSLWCQVHRGGGLKIDACLSCRLLQLQPPPVKVKMAPRPSLWFSFPMENKPTFGCPISQQHLRCFCRKIIVKIQNCQQKAKLALTMSARWMHSFIRI